MKFLVCLFFSLGLSFAQAQVEDHFDDGDFSSDPAWGGDVSEFNVNPAGQLQLNAASAGFSYLSVPAGLSTLDSCEWRFFIHLNFSPSSSNYARVYLCSDRPTLDQPLQGYFLRFGESLSDDAIELFRQDGTTETSICRGRDGKIANAFSAGVRVFRDEAGNWTLSADYDGGTNYSTEATGTDSLIQTAAYLGVYCEFTAGNVSKFYFDDFYAGPFIHDTIAPYVTGVEVESDSVISLTFSEPILPASLALVTNFSVDQGIGNPNAVGTDSTNESKIYLTFATRFNPNVTYFLSVTGLADLAQVPMGTGSFSFTYYPVAEAGLHDVVFTEIYFEPTVASPLPNAEYVEVYNRLDSSVNFSGWILSDGSSDGLLPPFRLGPHARAVLFDADDSAAFNHIPGAVPVPEFPALNNDVGDRLRLFSGTGEVIDEVTFDDSYYFDGNKNDGGWSIERIDPDFTCPDKKNWRAAVSGQHGTPGNLNSVNGVYHDTERPYVLNAFLADSFSLTIVFNEPVSFTASDELNYRVRGAEAGVVSPFLAALSPGGDTVVLFFQNAFAAGTYVLEIANAVTDCSGNGIDALQTVRIGFPEQANAGDIILNEVLFNPYEGGNDFLEIYNRSDKIIDLQGWTIAEADYEDSSRIKETTRLNDGVRLLFPGYFLVLTRSGELVRKFYSCPDPYAFLDLGTLPDFNGDEGWVVMYDAAGNTMDDLRYSENMHFPLITDPRGVSLERMSDLGTENSKNWHSAAATAGFATPGYRNSQRLGLSSGEDGIFVGEEIFSPDNDGYRDVLSIHYSYPQPGTVLSLVLFDVNGLPVRSLLSGKTVEKEGYITWDGLKDDATVSPSGIYILLARSFDLEGNNKTFKKAVFLTRKY